MSATLLTSGCANLASIDRSTDIPKNTLYRAVHLDAQQRLVIFSAKKYCAEPSPDALAAYASAIGLSISKLPDNAASSAMSNANSVLGIGLRTQSITLMRDTLYRMCEAAGNGDLTDLQVAMFLNKSQDLSMVILAIEQLTGAVAVSPGSVSGSASSSSSTTLLANAQALEAAKRIEENADTAKKQAEEDRNAKQTSLSTLEQQLKQKQEEIKTASPSEADKLRPVITDLEVKINQAKANLSLSEKSLIEKNATLKNATETRQAIELQRDSAILQANSNSSTTASESSISRQDRIDDKTATAIATSVENIVTKMLDQDYMEENCLLYVMQEGMEVRRDQSTISSLTGSQVAKDSYDSFKKKIDNNEFKLSYSSRAEVLAALDRLNERWTISDICIAILGSRRSTE